MFADNAIELKTLPHLSDNDLKDLGLPLGHRRLIQGALKGPFEPTAIQRADEAPAPKLVQAVPSAAAERRQLTVMFCDFGGSTALSTDLDPKAIRDVIRAYRDACTAVIERFGGFLAEYMGDGELFYLG